VLADGASELLLATRGGMAARFREADVRAMGRSAAGVRGIRLDEADEVVALVKAAAGMKILTVCRNGYGKRSAVEDYRLIRRGGRGVINIDASERNGPVVACMAVGDTDEVLAITSAGQIVRMPVSQIRLTGRGAQGVRVVSFKEEGDTLVSVARVPPEESEGPEGVGGAEGPDAPPAPAAAGAAEEGGAPSSASAEAAPEETEGPGAEDAPSDGDEADEKPGDEESGSQ